MDFRGDGRRRLPSLAGRFPSPSDSLGESPEGFNRWRTSRAAAADNLHDRPLQPKLVALLGQDQAGSWRPAERTTRRETTASGRCGRLSAERRETAGLPRPQPWNSLQRQTPRWREPDSNHRFRLRYSPWGSSLIVSADLSTLPSRKRSSQRTLRWRKGDSNPRSHREPRSGRYGDTAAYACGAASRLRTPLRRFKVY
jgi:hypothetical protein